MLSKEVDVTFANGRFGGDCYFAVVVVDPLAFLFHVGDEVTGVDARAQMRNEALQSVDTFVRLRILEGVFVFFCRLTDLIDLHVIFGVWLVHVAEDEVHSALNVVVAFAKSSAGLFVGQPHAHDHHHALFADLETAALCLCLLLFGLLDLWQWGLENGIVYVFVEPRHRDFCVLLAATTSHDLRVEDGVFC